jgi:hypothetical protein
MPHQPLPIRAVRNLFPSAAIKGSAERAAEAAVAEERKVRREVMIEETA